jgi:hypothetical protein
LSLLSLSFSLIFTYLSALLRVAVAVIFVGCVNAVWMNGGDERKYKLDFRINTLSYKFKNTPKSQPHSCDSSSSFKVEKAAAAAAQRFIHFLFFLLHFLR